jgi:hypothetical protein
MHQLGRLGTVHHLERAGRQHLQVGADLVEHVQVALGGHLLAVGGFKNFLVADLGHAAPVRTQVRQ